MRRILANSVWMVAILCCLGSGKAAVANSYIAPFASVQFSERPLILVSGNLYGIYVNTIYQSANLGNAGLDFNVFERALTGLYNLILAHKATISNVLTIVDYTKSSCSKRLWIIDLKQMKLVLQTWVAHGEGSGLDMANSFSNKFSSYKSSLGFYVTGQIYKGKHGRSLRLLGMDEGFNDNALSREIVLHAAPYVGRGAIKEMGRLGRSQGCPAVSPKVVKKIIELVKGQSVIYVNGNDDQYNSRYLDQNLATTFAVSNSTERF